MNKVPRFIKEYANYKRQYSKGMAPDEKYNYLADINKVIRSLERGLISIEEAMAILVTF